MKKEILEFIEQHQTEAIAVLQELGKIPAPSHQEDRRAEYCLNWFRDNGCPDAYIDEAKNVICRLETVPGEPFTVFMAHMDVVFPDTEPLPMTRTGSILAAPGIGDDTASLVSLMFGLRYVLQHRDALRHNFMIVANSCEEGLGNLDGTKQIFRDHGHEIARFYSFDGYIGGVTDTPVGSHRYRITVKTQGGHSYGDFGRDNAIEIMARIISELYAIVPPAESYTTYNVGTIEGGSTVNSIAQRCAMLYEYRSDNDGCLQTMKGYLDEILQAWQAKGYDVQCELLGVRPGMGAMDMAALQAFTEQNVSWIRECWNGEVKCRAASTDANIPLSMGIPGNTIGTITGQGAHTREEWIDLDSLPTAMAVVLNILDHQMN